MKLKNLIKQTIEMLARNDLLENNTFNSSSQSSPTATEQLEIDLFVKNFNQVYKEIASNYLPLLFEEEIQFMDKKFCLANLSKSVLEIFRLTTPSNKNISYELFSTYIKADTQNAKIVYSFIPNDIELNSDEEINFFAGKLLPQVICFGIAREYCLFNGFYSQAELWDSKFKDGILYAIRKKSPIFLKARGWF